jgi:phenylalanine-4-hydroxylase
MTGETDHKLRGDYSRMCPDYTVDQEWDGYSEGEHELWRRLYRRQASLIPKYACDEFTDALEVLHFGEAIPRFDAINELAAAITGSRGGAGLVPDLTFFDHLANRASR